VGVRIAADSGLYGAYREFFLKISPMLSAQVLIPA